MTTAVTPAEAATPDLILDESNPQSLINLVGDNVRNAIKTIPSNFIGHDEQYWRLRDRGKKEDERLSATDWKVRLSLWTEYNRSMVESKPFRTQYIYAGICTYGFFKKRYLENPERLAFVITPPSDYLKSLEECLYQNTYTLREVCVASAVRDDGSIDPKAAAVKLAVQQYFDARIYGSIAQNINQKSVNVNVNTDKSPVQAPQTVEELERFVQEMRDSNTVIVKKEIKDVPSSSGPE